MGVAILQWRPTIKSGFVKSTIVLMSGTITSQVVLLLCAPMLSRLYGPADFGDLANYNALTSILALIANFRYEHAILVARTRVSTNNVHILTLLLTFFSFVVLLLSCWLLHTFAPDIEYLQKISSFLFWIPFGVLVVCIYSSFTQLFIREGRFKLLSVVGLLNVVFTAIAQVLFDYLDVDKGLVVGTICGFCGSIILVVYYFVRVNRHHTIFYHVNCITLRQTAIAFRNFPRFNLPSDVLQAISQQFVPVVMLMLFNATIAGIYSFAMRIIRMPVIVLSTSVTAVLRKSTGGFAALSRLSLLQMHRKLVLSMATIAILPIVGLILFGEEIFLCAFGAQWQEAGRLSEILGVGVFFEFIGFPLSVFFVVTGKQRQLFRIQFFNSLLLFGAIYIGRRFSDGFLMVSVFVSIAMVLSNLILIYFSRWACSNYRIS